MTGDEMTDYLANLVFISSVDGQLNPLEAEGIEAVRRELGAEKGHLEKAVKDVAESRHRLTPVGKLSDRVKNLEDMVWISLVDGEFSQSEKPEILAFAKAIKVSQDQMNEILSEARGRIKNQKDACTCAACCKEVPETSKFCPFCGSAIG